MASLSVCIANYQGSAVIRACLDSVLAQQTDFRVEILVHDDCSSDGSADTVAAEYPGVTLIRSEENVGFCVSNNRLVEAASGDHILLLNNDASLRSGALQALHDYAVNHPGAGILSLPQYRKDDGELVDRGQFLDLFNNVIPNTDSQQREVATVMASCLWIRRSLWQDIGGFPEWFVSIAEDTYLCSVCRLMGKTVEVLPGPGYDHVVGGSFGGGKVVESGLSTSYARRSLSELNKNRVMTMCYPGPWQLPALLVHLPLLLIEGLLLSLLKRSPDPLLRIYWPSVAGVLNDLGRLGRERRRVQQLRRIGAGEFFSLFRWRHQKLALLLRYGIPRIN